MIRIGGPAALLLAASTTAAVAPFVDGVRDAGYGSPVAVQGSSVIEVLGGEDLAITAVYDNSNTGGVAAFGGGAATVFPPPDTAPGSVTTGIEIAISLDEIGWNGSDPIRIAGFMGDSGVISNQVIGGIGAGQDSLGDPSDVTIDFDSIAGDQFVTATTGSTTAATVDGVLDASYPAAQFVNTLASTFGSNTDSSATVSTGSELNGFYAYADADNLYLFWAGNQESSFDAAKLKLFIDARSGGQVVLTNTSSVDFNLLTEYNDLEFDSGFTADYWISMGNDSGGTRCLNVQDIPTLGDGAGGFACGGLTGSVDIVAPDAPNGGSLISVAADYSNTGGVAGVEFEDDFWDTDPETVETGFEFKIELDRIGYTSGSEIRIGGFIAGGDWRFLSNQVIGSLDTGIGNLGGFATASQLDFGDYNGDQFVSYTIPGSIPSSTTTIDGSIVGDSQYTLVWENDTPPGAGNASEFGNNDDSSAIDANGSELDAVRLSVANDPANGGALTLFGHVAGNLETNGNQLILFFDTDLTAGVGQNTINGNNNGLDSNGLNNIGTGNGDGSDPALFPGLTFDAGFEPDFVISYSGSAAQRDAYGAQLLAAGGGFGGQFFDRPQGTSPETGDLISIIEGFGDNTDPSVTFANGSELDNLAAIVDQNFLAPGSPELLHIMIGGNLQPNNNKLEVFIDVDPAAGQNTLIYDDPDDPNDAGNPDVNFNALNRMGGPTPDVFDDDNNLVEEGRPGFTFDDVFTADYFYTFSSSDGTTWFGDFARLRGVLADDPNNPGSPDPGFGKFLGSYAMPSSGGASNGDGDEGFNEATLFAIDNSNVGGVEGAPDQFGAVADAPNVTTGIEIGIPLSDINWDPSAGDTIKVTVFINGQGHDFVSNQFLGFACVSDLGEPRDVDLGAIDGPQYVELQFNANGSSLPNVAPAPADCIEPPACVVCPDTSRSDGQVNTDDLLAVLGAFGQTGAPGDFPGDTTCDGAVNTDDLLAVLGAFGTNVTCP